MKGIIVLYHADCPDGFGGAWAAWKKFGKRADYIPAKHQVPPDPKLKNKEIYLLDFSYLGAGLKNLVRRNKKVTTIDHHVSVKNELKNASEYLFALNHSGAGLAWRYFHPGKKVPKLIQYVEDQDLWNFKLAKPREVMAAVNLKPLDFKIWNQIGKELEQKNGWKKYAEKGATIIEYENKTINDLMKKVEPAVFHGHRAGVINSPILQSELGYAIYSRGFPIAIIWSRQNSQIRVSLRSNGKIDAAKLSQKYGGGGHKTAAGFKLAVNKPLPWKMVKTT